MSTWTKKSTRATAKWPDLLSPREAHRLHCCVAMPDSDRTGRSAHLEDRIEPAARSSRPLPSTSHHAPDRSNPPGGNGIAAQAAARPGSAPQAQPQRPALHVRPAGDSFESEADRAPGAQAQSSIPSPFGSLTTYAQLAAYARVAIAELQGDLADTSRQEPLRGRANEWIRGVRGWLPVLDSQGDAQLSPAVVAQAMVHIEDGLEIRKALEDARRAAVRHELEETAAAAEAAAAETTQLLPSLKKDLRAAYHAGDTNRIADLAEAIGTVLDVTLGFHELARQAYESIAEFKHIDVAAVSKYTAALTTLNKGLAALNLAFSLAQGQAATQLAEATRWINVATGAFSSLGTLAGLPAHMGLYANLYLVPLTKCITKVIARLEVLLQEENDAWIELTGEPGRYAVEPGGKPVWRFMKATMQAGSVSAMPPINDDVATYLLEHRDQLEAGAGEAIPTSGWWLWRSLRTDAAKRWIFAHRDRLWAMFYGNRAVPQ